MNPLQLHEIEIYEFGRFRLDAAQKILLLDGELVRLTPKLYVLLAAFVESGGRVLGKDELMERLWPDTFVEDATLARNISRLKQILGDDHLYIETLPGFGYRFTLPVTRVSGNAAQPQEQPSSAIEIEQHNQSPSDVAEQSEADVQTHTELAGNYATPSSGHWLYVTIVSAAYAALYAVGLLVEVAYEFDRYGSAAAKVAAAAFLWVLITSVGGFAINRRLTLKGKRSSLLVSALLFAGAALSLYIAASFFLPARPITQATFQTYTAQTSYLRVICYFLALALVFLITPYHFVIALQREIKAGNRSQVSKWIAGGRRMALPRGTIYIKAQTLAALLIIALAAVLVGTHFLFSSLMPSRFHNLFSNLLYVRLILFFGLGLYCLVWYYRALDDLKRESKATSAI